MINPSIKDDIHELLVAEAGMTAEQWVRLCEFHVIDSSGEKSDYFNAPASSKYHNNFKGGLAAHSLNVCNTALKINDSLNLGLKRSNVILACLLHDLSKVTYYTPNILKSGKQSESVPYNREPTFFMPHGADSLYLVNNVLKMEVSQDVATAICYHMPFDYNDLMQMSNLNKMAKMPTTMMLVWLVQMSDLFASQIMEVKQ